MSTMLRTRFDQELAKLDESILDLGSRALQAVTASLRALADNDEDLAADVIAGDLTINALRYRIEKVCYGLLVMEQPVAKDMRQIVAALIIANELEHIADHGKRIAKFIQRIGLEPRAIPLTNISRMGELAVELLDRALQVYARRDTAAAQQVCQDDDQVDHLYKQTFNITLSYMLEAPKNISAGTYLIQVAHELERVGDRATNIAERVIYAETGELNDLNV